MRLRDLFRIIFFRTPKAKSGPDGQPGKSFASPGSYAQGGDGGKGVSGLGCGGSGGGAVALGEGSIAIGGDGGSVHKDR